MLSKRGKVAVGAVVTSIIAVLILSQMGEEISRPEEVTVVYATPIDNLIATHYLLKSGVHARFTKEDPREGTVVVVGGPTVNPLTKKFADEGYLDVSIIDRWFYPKVWWDVHFGLFEIKKIETENATYIVVWGTGMDGTAAGMSVLASAWKLNVTLPDHVIGMWYDTFPGTIFEIKREKGHDVGFGPGDYIVTNITKEIYKTNYQQVLSLVKGNWNLIFTSRDYYVPSYKTLLQFLAIDTTDEMKHSEDWYCVDFARQLSLRAKYYGINSIGIVLGERNGKKHVWNIAVYREGDELDYVFIEPQSDRIFKSDPEYKPETIIMLGG